MGHFWPMGHDSWDLCKNPHNNAAYQIQKLWLLWFERKRVFHVFPIIKPMPDNDAPGARSIWSIWTPGAQLPGSIKRTTIHCYAQDMKALGLVVSEKKIFFMFFTL